MTTTATIRPPDQYTPAQPLPPARKRSAVVIGLWRFVRLFCRWVPEVNIETAGSWRLVSLWGTTYASVYIDSTTEVRGHIVGKSDNHASAARWADALLALPNAGDVPRAPTT